MPWIVGGPILLRAVTPARRHLWEMPAKEITAHPRYQETADWLIRFAAKSELDPELRDLWSMMQEDAGWARRVEARPRRAATKKKARKAHEERT